MSGGEPRAGDRAGPWVLESPLGVGGFASVWVARQADGRAAVLKLLRGDVPVDGPARARFAREVGVLAKLDHPGIVRLIGHDLTARPPYFVMERVVGQSLRHRVMEASTVQRPLMVAQAAAVVRGLADAIAYAHASGVIHRDLKPANVLLDVDDAPRVLDFGLARLMGADRHAATTLGRIMGTRYYWAPEQAMGEEATAATDQFSLATIAFELLTLRRAWVRGEADQEAPEFHLPVSTDLNRPLSILERLRSGARPRASHHRAGVSGAVDAVLTQAWSVDPRARFADIRAFEEALSEALDDPGTQVHADGQTLVLPTRVSPTALAARRAEELPMPMMTTIAVERPVSIRIEGGSGRRWMPMALVAAAGVCTSAIAYQLGRTDRAETVALAPAVVVPTTAVRAVGPGTPMEAAWLEAAPAEASVVNPPATPASSASASSAASPRGLEPPAQAPDPHPRAPRSRPSGAAAATPSPAAMLHARLDALAARPDLAQLAIFADQLDALADAITSPDARARVRRLVATGAAVGDVGRLRQALTELERAGALD